VQVAPISQVTPTAWLGRWADWTFLVLEECCPLLFSIRAWRLLPGIYSRRLARLPPTAVAVAATFTEIVG